MNKRNTGFILTGLMSVIVASVLTLGSGCGQPDLTEDLPKLERGPGGASKTQPMEQVGTGDWQQGLQQPAAPANENNASERRLDMKIYFAFDRSSIGKAERPKLEQLAKYLKKHDSYELVIEGHTDRRGSKEYNRGLSERRALSVKSYLENLGISPDRMQTVPYGEEKPAVENAQTEQEYQQNRRAEFIVKAD